MHSMYSKLSFRTSPEQALLPAYVHLHLGPPPYRVTITLAFRYQLNSGFSPLRVLVSST